MSTILAVYGTAYGHTERVVGEVVRILEENGHAVTTMKGDRLPRDFSLRGFDAVLVASSVLLGRHQRYIRQFVRRYTAELNALPTALISVSGSAARNPAEARGYVDRLVKETGWRPGQVELVGGVLAYTRYGIVTRWVIRAIARRNGGPTDTSRDHEFTDWPAVLRFAREFAGMVGRPSPMEVPAR
jgi:menaquinone-dependent protoporphyrinogen oxidase